MVHAEWQLSESAKRMLVSRGDEIATGTPAASRPSLTLLDRVIVGARLHTRLSTAMAVMPGECVDVDEFQRVPQVRDRRSHTGSRW